MATTRRIRLTKYIAENVNYTYYGAYRMKVAVTAVEGDDLDKYVFIYKKGTVSPYSELSQDDFMAIAGPSQFASIPAVSPDPDQNYPFFRLDYVELDFMSVEQADQAWTDIQAEVGKLVEGMGKLTKLKAVEDVWFPSPPPANSQSESNSE
jgi:hypothetical protein